MNSCRFKRYLLVILSISILLASSVNKAGAQDRSGQRLIIGIHADPLITWFGSDNSTITNKGARPGFNFGLSVYKFFGPNYAFSTGINLISAGGRLVSSDTTVFHGSDGLNLRLTKVNPGQAIVYKIQYLSIPIGLKLQTNQIGYIRVFTDLGIDPKVVIGSKADIPSKSIKNEGANLEIRSFNMSYHILAGIEYGIGGNTAVVLGLGFENNFLDITDESADQPAGNIYHRIISFRLGVNF